MVEHQDGWVIDPDGRPEPRDDAEERNPKSRARTRKSSGPSPRPPGYQIVLGQDTIVSLTQAAGLIPPRRRGRKTHASTLFRWSTAGCRGIVMPTIQCGGTRCTSVEAIQWFFEQLTERSRDRGKAEDAAIPLRRSPSQRRRQSEEAGRRLEQLGA